jgi:hypothetical protein
MMLIPSPAKIYYPFAFKDVSFCVLASKHFQPQSVAAALARLIARLLAQGFQRPRRRANPEK